MNFKTTIALIIILAGLGGYLFYTNHSTPTAKPSSSETHKLIDLQIADVTRFTVASLNGKPITFEKFGDNWQMTEPMRTPADNAKVTDLLTAILGLESHEQLDASQKSANGLDHPDYTISITTKDRTAKLFVGDKPPIGDTLAVLLDGKDKPDVVDVSLFASLEQKASTYRKTHLISGSSDLIRQIAITHGKQTIRLEKTGTDWTITAPQRMPADAAAMDGILSGITDLTAVSFDDIDTPADAGLLKPKLTIWFSNAAASTQPTTAPASQPAGTTIKLGGYEDVSQKNILANVDDGPIVALAASTLDIFKKTPLDLRDKNVVNIDPDHVESVSLEVSRAASTKPAILPEHHVFHLERRKKVAVPLGPALPTSNPTTAPSTQPASVWTFKDAGDANDSQVAALLNALHPLHADSFADASTTQPTGTVYTLSIQTGPSAGAAPTLYNIRFVDPGQDQKLIGSYENLTFQLDHSAITSFQADFKPTN